MHGPLNVKYMNLCLQYFCFSIILCWQRPCDTPDDGQTNCPKHVGLYSKNKYGKLVHLVGFIIRI